MSKGIVKNIREICENLFGIFTDRFAHKRRMRELQFKQDEIEREIEELSAQGWSIPNGEELSREEWPELCKALDHMPKGGINISGKPDSPELKKYKEKWKAKQ